MGVQKPHFLVSRWSSVCCATYIPIPHCITMTPESSWNYQGLDSSIAPSSSLHSFPPSDVTLKELQAPALLERAGTRKVYPGGMLMELDQGWQNVKWDKAELINMVHSPMRWNLVSWQGPQS